jgi:hypothetical protein
MKYFLLITLFACAQTPKKNENFWVLTSDLAQTRGGTTQGETLTLETQTPESWKKLKELKISQKERDRRAILNLVGEYRTSFEFLETIRFVDTKKKYLPYRSWGTEVVFAIEEKEDFISLQHIMVMRFVDPKTGKISGPHVMKHWRQDWKWQAQEQFVYEGSGVFKTKKIKPQKGFWLWSVYQVDDSPRYSALGSWEHHEGSSLFKMNDVSRPLPRRESEIRKDYDILKGEERLIVTKLAWYHEQANFKQKKNRPIAREIGHNTYQRISGFDFTAAHKYWSESKNYWAQVRQAWQSVLKTKPRFTLKEIHEGTPLFVPFFMGAQNPEFQSDSKKAREQIQEVLGRYIQYE